jgi:hypothetical protein
MLSSVVTSYTSEPENEATTDRCITSFICFNSAHTPLHIWRCGLVISLTHRADLVLNIIGYELIDHAALCTDEHARNTTHTNASQRTARKTQTHVSTIDEQGKIHNAALG